MEYDESRDTMEEVTIQLSAKGGQGVINIAWGTMRLTASFSAAK